MAEGVQGHGRLFFVELGKGEAGMNQHVVADFNLRSERQVDLLDDAPELNPAGFGDLRANQISGSIPAAEKTR